VGDKKGIVVNEVFVKRRQQTREEERIRTYDERWLSMLPAYKMFHMTPSCDAISCSKSTRDSQKGIMYIVGT
jgi:hypothetical protein